ncbi:hypothetical protein J7L48_04780 [bacterium]|nr:hypothetical protein [bacterium]
MKALLKKYDTHNLFELLNTSADHIVWSLKNFPNIRPRAKYDKIVIMGMGGSAISGIIAKSFLEKILSIPIIVLSQDTLPKYSDDKTLLIPISYSGGTKETKRMISQCNKCSIYGISTNSKLTKKVIIIPKGLPPRFGFYYLFSNLLLLVGRIFNIPDIEVHLRTTVELLREREKEFSKKHSLPWEMATQLQNKPILIYAPSILKGVAYRWKTQFNENSKHFAFYNYFPELCHNEIVPFINGKQGFHLVSLRSGEETKIEKLDSDFFKSYIDFEIEFNSENFIQELLQLILLGDYVSFYLGLLKGVNPYDIDLIDQLKKTLNSNETN